MSNDSQVPATIRGTPQTSLYPIGGRERPLTLGPYVAHLPTFAQRELCSDRDTGNSRTLTVPS